MLQRSQSFPFAFVVSGIVLLTFTSVVRAQSAPQSVYADSPYDLINAVNGLRAAYGLAPYTISPILMGTAQGHADYMAATENVSHTGAGGSSVTDRLLNAGYPLAGDLSLGGFRSENVTAGNENMSAESTVNQWTGDSIHLNTMISADLTEIGAGIAVNAGRAYFVIDCARPKDSGLLQTAGTSLAGESTPVPAEGVVPVVIVTPNADGEVIHEVKSGQTLWQIAISYKTTIDEIKSLNNLNGNNIYPGTKLLIKQGLIVTPIVTFEMTVPELVASATNQRTMTATANLFTLTPTLMSVPVSTPTHSLMGIVIGIILVALLGGGLFVRFGSLNRARP